MRIAGTRFGSIEVDEERAMTFPRGLIGFPDKRRYVLLEPRGNSRVAWLQSLEMPALAFPVLDGTGFGDEYPQPRAKELAKTAGLGMTEVAVLVVVAVASESKGLLANMLAPLVVDLETRTGAQVVLDHHRFSAATPLGV